MFKNLKKKLKGFRKQAEEEFEEIIVAEVAEGDFKDAEIIDASLVEIVEVDPADSKEKSEGKKSRKDKKKDRKREKRPEEARLGKKLRSKVLDNILPELELILMESDVALPVVDEVIEELRGELEGLKIKRKEDVGDFIEGALKRAIRNVLITNPIDFLEFIRGHEKPVKLMFVGVNGTGKTTSIAKLVHYLRNNGLTSVIAAADTFRAGAIEQLEVHAGKLGVRLIKHQSGGDPAAVAYDAVEHAIARKRDVVLIDTAGRMQTNKNLMNEMIKIKRVAKPDMIIFVGDSLAGNDAVEQASRFNDAVNIDGAILSKIDSDARGGAALSIAHAVGKPILFVGVGQEYEDLEPFSADWMVNRLFGDD
jgi:fused signal recognition particle receptor